MFCFQFDRNDAIFYGFFSLCFLVDHLTVPLDGSITIDKDPTFNGNGGCRGAMLQ